MPPPADIEAKVDKECSLILKTDSEFWEIRNKAMLSLLALAAQYEGSPPELCQKAWNLEVFRILKDPIKSMIADLRSQQVRDTCLFLQKLSEVLGDHLKHLLREIFPSILDGIKVPNRVMSGFVDTLIIGVIKHTTFKMCFPILITEVKENKAKFVRERCLEYINEILVTWSITDKEADALSDAIKAGLEDASVRGREIARLAYLNMFQLFPKKTERIKSLLAPQVRSRLVKAEAEHLKHVETLQAQQEHESSQKVEEALETTIEKPAAQATSDKASKQPTEVNTINIISHNDTRDNGIGDGNDSISTPLDDDGNEISTFPSEEVTPNKINPLRARRQSYEEDAVTSIQAIIRGKLTRKQSLLNSDSPSSSMKSSSGRIGDGAKPALTVETDAAPSDDTETAGTTQGNSSAASSPSLSPLSSTWKSRGSESGGSQQSKLANNVGMVPYTSPPRSTSSSIPRPSSKNSSPSSSSSSVFFPPSSSSSSAVSPPSTFSSSSSSSSSSALPRNSSSSRGGSLEGSPSVSDWNAQTYPDHLSVGMQVSVKGKDPHPTAIIRFLGLTSFSTGYWVGLELPNDAGKNNGTVGTTEYFTCPANHGLFVRPWQVVLPDNRANNNTDGTRAKGTISAEKRSKIAGLLKLKISSLVDLINQQLELVEEIENASAVSLDVPASTVEDIISLNEQEMALSQQFSAKFQSLL